MIQKMAPSAEDINYLGGLRVTWDLKIWGLYESRLKRLFDFESYKAEILA